IEQSRRIPRTAMKSLVAFCGNLMKYSVPELVNNTMGTTKKPGQSTVDLMSTSALVIPYFPLRNSGSGYLAVESFTAIQERGKKRRYCMLQGTGIPVYYQGVRRPEFIN